MLLSFSESADGFISLSAASRMEPARITAVLVPSPTSLCCCSANGAKKCEAGVKIPLGRNYGREKICHMDNRSGQWAGGERSIMEEIPAPSFSFLPHFWSRFPRGKEKHAHTHLTYSWQCKIAFHAQLTLHPFGIHFGSPDFSQENCTWQNWLESH